MRHRSVLFGFLTIAAAGLLVACGDDPSAVKPSPLTPSPTESIEVTGPDALLAGQSVQFVAKVRQSDGTTKSATSMPGLVWLSSNTSAASVSNSGVVTARSTLGDTVITALQGAVRGTREVAVRAARAPVLAVEASRQGTPGPYVFTVRLTEQAGEPMSISAIWIFFDDYGGAQCKWTPNNLSQTRVPANGTLALDPLTCSNGDGEAVNADVSIELKDDKGRIVYVSQWLQPVVR